MLLILLDIINIIFGYMLVFCFTRQLSGNLSSELDQGVFKSLVNLQML